MKGQIGTSLGGSIEYTRQVSSSAKDCRNCRSYKRAGEKWERKPAFCKCFGFQIADTTTAKCCKAFDPKRGKKRSHAKSPPKSPRKKAN